jgi:CBS domain-containing protein
MRRHWIAVAPGTNLTEAEELMRLARVRQVPVEEAGQLVGLLDHRELVEVLLDGVAPEAGAVRDANATDVRAVMDDRPPTASPGEPVGAAALRMVDAGLGCLPVVAAGRLVGLLVESDLLRCAYEGGFPVL